MVERLTEQLMVGGSGGAAAAGAAATIGVASIISTPSPRCTSSNVSVVRAAAVPGVVLMTINSPSERRGSSPDLVRKSNFDGSFCVGSEAGAWNGSDSAGFFETAVYSRVM